MRRWQCDARIVILAGVNEEASLNDAHDGQRNRAAPGEKLKPRQSVLDGEPDSTAICQAHPQRFS